MPHRHNGDIRITYELPCISKKIRKYYIPPLVAEFSNNKSLFPIVGKLFSTTFVDRRGGR
jgi:hypothetical protein